MNPAMSAARGETGALPRNRLLVGDAAAVLRGVPDSSVDTVVTSPPYFRLRDYQVDGQLGLELHVDDWVDGLLGVSRELRRVLVESGTLWLNLGDSFATHQRQGAPRKSLLLGPERLALAMAADGWVLRNKIVWAKTNARPSSVVDRLTCTWEPIYLFAASSRVGQRTFFNLDAVRVPHRSRSQHGGGARRRGTTVCAAGVSRPDRASWRGPNTQGDGGLHRLRRAGVVGHPLGKNPGDVWPLASSRFRGAHHATFPLALAERMIRAGCPEFRCQSCRRPWVRTATRRVLRTGRGALQATCDCRAGREPGVVLDPFMGAGTTAVAAEALRRDWLGVELNPAFGALAEQRIEAARIDVRCRGRP